VFIGNRTAKKDENYDYVLAHKRWSGSNPSVRRKAILIKTSAKKLAKAFLRIRILPFA
jgi:hypothetical protein